MSRQSFFTEQLNYFLQKKGVSKATLAAYLGCLPNIVESWLKGERYPGEEKISAIAKFFGVSKEMFFEKKNEEEEEDSLTPSKKNITVGHCVRCGKPIKEHDKFGMGSAKQVVKNRFLQNPVEEIVYEYDPQKPGYDYFCEACCNYLLESKKLAAQNHDRQEFVRKKNIKNRAFLSGILTLLSAILLGLFFVWDVFKIFPWNIEDPYRYLIFPASLVLAYFVFSFILVILSRNNWVGKGLTSIAKALYVESISSVFKSDNGVLYMGTVKFMVAVAIVAVCSMIFIPLALVFGVFSMFAWPHSLNVLNKDIKTLSRNI